MKLTKASTIQADVKFELPGDGVNVWKPASFKAEFRSLTKPEIQDLAESNLTNPELLEKVLIDVQGVETDEVHEDGTPYTPREIVICNQFSANAAARVFWEAANRGKEGNSKKSRGR